MKESADWAVLELPGVMEVVGKAASRVASTYPGMTEVADMEQEACIELATHGERVRGHVANDDLGLVYNWLTQWLAKVMRPQTAYFGHTVSIERLADE